MADNSLITQEQYNADIKRLYDEKIYPFLNGATHTGCVPLGTILPYFGETAPTHFLICDGTEYAKADYPELAEHLLALTDPTPYAGSDANHFKVPDLRGEFLRGSGTNGHTDQGSGANVGVHQDATEIPWQQYWTDNQMIVSNKNTNRVIKNSDKIKYDNTQLGRSLYNVSATDSFVDSPISHSVRPTNTSVTYIIAYRNAYIDLALDSFPIDIAQPTDGQLLMYDATAGRWVNGGHKYSTDEHIVGTWIDGKPVYEKTIVGDLPTTRTEGTDVTTIIDVGQNVDTFFYHDALIIVARPNNEYIYFGEYANMGSDTYRNVTYFKTSSNVLQVTLHNKYASWSGKIITIFRYTKTTDTV